jgi:hypothetical protein
VQLAIDKVHIKSHVANTVTTPTAAPVVAIGTAALDWTVAPRFEMGYRLPSGFGEFAIGYRFLATDGRDTSVGLDGPAARRSRFALNELDFDYGSREFSLWPCCDLTWRVGLRVDWVYFDTTATEAVGLAAAGSGIVAERSTNSYVGVGPHTGMEVAQHLGQSGWSVVLGTDLAIELGRIRQQNFAAAQTPGGSGQVSISGSQGVPQARFDVGAKWQREGSALTVFLGYHYDYWWDVGRLNVLAAPPSRGEFSDQGFLATVGYQF